MMNARRTRFWYRIHKWTSLVCTAFLLMSCLTGLPLIFDVQLLQLTSHEIRPAALPASAPYASLDRIVEAGRRKLPGEQALSLAWDQDEPRVLLHLAPDFSSKPADSHTLIFDAHTGALLQESPPAQGFIYEVYLLHVELFSGLPGELFLGFMASLFVIALVSGAVVYGPFMRRLEFGTVRKKKSNRLKWFDLHNLIGIVTLSWALVVGVTGFMNTLSGPLFDLWRSQTLPELLAPYHAQPLAGRTASLDAVVQTARVALPFAEITSITFPNNVTGSPRHFLIWTRGRTPITSRLFTPVLVDAVTGKLTTVEELPWYLRALEVSRPLHFGDYGGLPLEILWAFFDLALITVLLSGVYLWLSRRKTPVEDELDRLVKLEDLAAEETSVTGVSMR